MYMMMKVSEFVSCLGDSVKALVKMMLQSRRTIVPLPCAKGGDSIIILGNGPSLKDTLTRHAAEIVRRPVLAVNFMANAPQFNEIRPDYYVLADPHFFTGTGNANVDSLWRVLASVDWPMTLSVPVSRLRCARRLLGDIKEGGLRLATFNFVGIEGFRWLEDMAFGSRLAMPRPRNVMIPAVMTAIAAGYKRIYLTGADHSWLETIRVTDRNHVVSVQPHFYADSKTELKRSESEYRGYHLHDILYSFYTAFRSYHTLRRYADLHGISIYNATPGSYIDAFDRCDSFT